MAKGVRRDHPPRFPLPASLPGIHALLTPAVAHAFETLRIGATIRADNEWYAIHAPPDQITLFELSHGRETERDAYNAHGIEQAWGTGRTVLGQHAGHSDYFVPVYSGGKVRAVVVTGPFATRRPTAADLLERWRAITGKHGRMSDREFSR